MPLQLALSSFNYKINLGRQRDNDGYWYNEIDNIYEQKWIITFQEF
jgi:hypothetical protein